VAQSRSMTMKGKRRYADLLGFLGDVGMPMLDAATIGKAKKSGVRLVHLTTSWPMRDWEGTLRMHVRVAGELERRPQDFQIIRSRRDLENLEQDSRIGVILGMQDPTCIGARLDRVETLFQEGLRTMQVAYQVANPYGSGFVAEKTDQGLTSLGKEFLAAVEGSGLIPDLSHLSMQTCLDSIRILQGPVMISHTTARAVYDHPRGSGDDVFRALAEKRRTLVGVLAMTFFLDPVEDGLGPFVRHLRHIRGVIGKERVAIGSDGPVGGFTDLGAAKSAFLQETQNLMDPQGRLKSRWPTHIPELSHNPHGFDVLREALLPHFTAEEVDAILGRNAWRFFEESLPG